MISWFKHNHYVIGSATDLRRLKHDIRYFRPRKYSNISVQLPSLQREENDYIEQRITAHYFMCGCTHGKIAAVISLILVTAYFVLQGYTVESVPFGLAIGGIASVSVGVKILAQVHAKRALDNYLKQLIAHIESR